MLVGPPDWNSHRPVQVAAAYAPSVPFGGAASEGLAVAAASSGGAGSADVDQAKMEENDDLTCTDTASMAVLAPVKRKERMAGDEVGASHTSGSTGTSNSNSAEWNTSNSGGSEASSQKRRVRIQQPPLHDVNDGAVNEPDWNENSDEQARPIEGQHQRQHQQAVQQQRQHAAGGADDRQESSTSASSSSGGRGDNDDNPQLAQAAPLHYGVPAVVSEYSSSRNDSSGASKSNAMSTSGSGSGGNTGSGTGSGTASGSNQGGSSGSGNDQGGISSHGNGSSGSGSDVKGSSEENMDNSGENNSGENSGGNSDGSNRATVKFGPTVAFEVQDASNIHRHPVHASEPLQGTHHHSRYSHGSMPTLHTSDSHGNDEAIREKKIQDKKRKRMNMRREYEEKVEQEMESSEASQDREVLIRPGKPITLDKVLSFTKTPRVVVKADPPFLVLYANAAYCRLSGIDSHYAVGKPIRTLLALPDQYDMAQLDSEKEFPPTGETATSQVSKTAESDRNATAIQGKMETSVGTDNHFAAEAAGRARAATSKEENTGVGLERLMSASGFNQLHVIKVRSKPHHMLGRNVKILKPQSSAQSPEDGSNGSSISSTYDGPHHFAACTMSISPVVSSPEAYNVAVVTDSGKADNHGHKHKRSEQEQENHQHKAKRRKHHHHYHQHSDTHHHGHHLQSPSYGLKEPPNQPWRHLVSHYVIQLEPFDGNCLKLGPLESQSSASTTVESKISVRRTAERIQWQRTHNQNGTENQDDDNQDDALDSEISEPHKHVSAIA
jgi:hypothetical protein